VMLLSGDGCSQQMARPGPTLARGSTRVGSGVSPDDSPKRSGNPGNVYVTLASLDVLLVMSIAAATVLASNRTNRLAKAPTAARRRMRALTASIALSFAGAFVILRTITDAFMLLTPDRPSSWQIALTATGSMAPVAGAVLLSGAQLRALADGEELDVRDPYLVVPVRVAAAASLLGVWTWFEPPALPYWDDIALVLGVLTAAMAVSIVRRSRGTYRSPVTTPVD
jgi:hypothetical protein